MSFKKHILFFFHTDKCISCFMLVVICVVMEDIPLCRVLISCNIIIKLKTYRIRETTCFGMLLLSSVLAKKHTWI
jgi:hypothetical protein